MAQQAQLALGQVRQLAKGLFPIDVDAEGLLPALRELASTTESLHTIQVRVTGNGAGLVRDSRMATQIFRIAQEAVTNAVKHAQADSVGIIVTGESGLAKLRVIDNGVGIKQGASTRDGVGLRIMRYRALSIGAVLSIDPGSNGGTEVTCTWREPPAAGDPLTTTPIGLPESGKDDEP